MKQLALQLAIDSDIRVEKLQYINSLVQLFINHIKKMDLESIKIGTFELLSLLLINSPYQLTLVYFAPLPYPSFYYVPNHYHYHNHTSNSYAYTLIKLIN